MHTIYFVGFNRAPMSENKSNKYLSFVKSELSGQFDDLRITSAEKIAASSSSTFSWLVIGIFGFFTYMSFILFAPLAYAYAYVEWFSGTGNPVLRGYFYVFAFHFIIFLLLLIFRKSLLQKKVYNKVFEAIFNIGDE